MDKAAEVRRFYEHVNVTGYHNFIKLLDQNYFRDYPITSDGHWRFTGDHHRRYKEGALGSDHYQFRSVNPHRYQTR